jgi:hypothetical protein
MGTEIQEQLSKALSGVDKQYARLAKDRMTKVAVYDAPFLNEYRIYRVRHLNPHKPIVFYVGFAPRKRAYLLTGAPENMTKLAKADGVVIDSPEVAATFASTFLEVTRSMARLFYQVQSVDELKFRPNLPDEQRQVKEEIETKYRSIISPPAAEPADSGYAVTVYAVREQALERHSVRVSRDGDISDEVSVLETGLPLVYGL